jgi:endo-1,4-beta-xylanase
MWSNGTGSACITLNSANSYSTQWSGIGGFVAQRQPQRLRRH